MSFLEHLDELRKRIIRSLLSLCVGVAIAAFFIEDLYAFVMAPLAAMLGPDNTFEAVKAKSCASISPMRR